MIRKQRIRRPLRKRKPPMKRNIKRRKSPKSRPLTNGPLNGRLKLLRNKQRIKS